MATKLKRFLRSTRGAITLNDLPQIGLSLLVAAVVLVIVFVVFGQLQSTSTIASSSAANSTIGNVSGFITNLTTLLPVAGTIFGVGLLFFGIMAGIGYMNRGKGGGV